jgi:16S rRNA G1207 methylase RsmC
MYTRAREDQADTLADQIIAIADQHPETITVLDSNGEVVETKVDSALIAWQKNRIEARKWTAAKLKPRKYGERTTLAGDADNPVTVTQRSETLDTFLLNIQLLKQTRSK